MNVVVVIEDGETQGLLIQQWIKTAIVDVKVSWFRSPLEAEPWLQEYMKAGVVKCIVLDMFFRQSMTKKDEALGEEVLIRYPDTPIVLISGYKETRTWERRRDDVPLLHLDKPRFLSGGNVGAQEAAKEFRRDLVEAVKCGLIVGSLRGQVAQLTKKKPWQPVFQTRVGLAAVIFLACLLVYATAVLYAKEFVQHILLAFSAVSAVHLLDRAVLFKDFRDAFQAVSDRLADLSVEVQGCAQKIREMPPRLNGDDKSV